MTYKNLCKHLAGICSTQDYISQIKFGSVYDVNSEDDTYYPLLTFELLNSKVSDNNQTEYKFRMVYVDMLTEESSNVMEIREQLNYTFNSLLRVFDYEHDVDFKYVSDVQYIEQELKDKVGGGYVTVSITDYSPYAYCPDIHPEQVVGLLDKEYATQNQEYYAASLTEIRECKKLWDKWGIKDYNTSYYTIPEKWIERIKYLPIINTSLKEFIDFSAYKSIRTIPRLNTNSVTSMEGMFSGCERLITIPELHCDKVLSTKGMFKNCVSLVSVPKLNLINNVNADEMFSGCRDLVSIIELNLSKVESAVDIFSGCESLEHVTFIKESINIDLDLRDTILSRDSIHSLINGLNPEVSKTLTFTVMCIEEDLVQLIKGKGWNVEIVG